MTTPLSDVDTAHHDTAHPVNVLFLIDASGSMGPVTDDVIGGFNSYVEGLKLDPAGGPYTLTALTFETKVTTLFANNQLIEVPALTRKLYQPGGGTALYDAVGAGLLALKLDDGSERYLVIIQTDGQENASHRFSKADIAKIIAERTLRGNWTFVYLGADQDAWQSSAQLGIVPGNTLAYNSGSTHAMMHSLVSETSFLSGSATASSTTFAERLGGGSGA